MTTIAFKDGWAAADRMITEGRERYGECAKIAIGHDAEGTSFIAAAVGTTCLAQRFRRWALEGFAKGEPPPSMKDGDAESSGLLLYGDGRLVTLDPCGPIFTVAMNRDRNGVFIAAFGSGGEYALGAMAIGATAAQAVDVACRFDMASGGGIDILSLPR